MVIHDIDSSEKKSIEKSEKKEEPHYEKQHEKLTYKILKYNPIDPINDFGRKIAKRLQITDLVDHMHFWAVWVVTREVSRRYWNIRIEYVDKTLFPEFGGGIAVSNHQSHLDPFFLGGSVPRRIRFMSKPENFKTPIVRTLFRNAGAFKVRRGEHDLKSWNKAKGILKAGNWVGMFPEGTRSYDGEVQEFHSGSVRLAIEAGVPIVPTCIIGSRKTLKKGALFMKPTPITVRIGKPIYYTDYLEGDISYEEARRLSDELRQEVVRLKEATTFKHKEHYPADLSIGSPETIERREEGRSGGFVKRLKRVFIDTLWSIDDHWYYLLKILGAFGLRERFCQTMWNFSGDLLYELCKLMIPFRMIDYDKYFPHEGGAVIAPSHSSEWDVIILAISVQQQRRRLFQMAKESLFNMPLVNAWVRIHHAFPIKREESDIGSYNFAKEKLEEGHLVAVYPEGTKNDGDGNLLPGHVGAVRLAIETKTPIIPVGITGSADVFPTRAKMLNFGKGVILKMGKPFREHEKFFDSSRPPTYEELKELTKKLMQRIKDLLLYDNPDA